MRMADEADAISDDEAKLIFDGMIGTIHKGKSNRHRLKLLFQQGDLYRQLTQKQLINNIERYKKDPTDHVTKVHCTTGDTVTDDDQQVDADIMEDVTVTVSDENGDDDSNSAPSTPISQRTRSAIKRASPMSEASPVRITRSWQQSSAILFSTP